MQLPRGACNDLPLAKSVVVTMLQQPRLGLARSFGERQSWSALFASGKMLIPEQVVDGLNLIWYSDLVMSGGGTMNREAAALGVPAYSIFRGKIGAIDQYLCNCGRLVLLESVEQISQRVVIAPHARPAKPQHARSAALEVVIGHILRVLELTSKPLH